LKDLFGVENRREPVHVNIYADEIVDRKCPFIGNSWHYIGLIVENIETPLLSDIINERFMGNFDHESKYFDMNNKKVHWCEIRIADTKNICKRWFEYILSPGKSRNTFYSYILGINDSLLDKDSFDTVDHFGSQYNRFFRSAVLYGLKSFFGDHKIIVENIFHEEGQQQDNEYFPWHIIYKLGSMDSISFNCDEITFLPKDHKDNIHSNLIQLCDTVLGSCTSIIHGIVKSKKSFYREELIDLYLPLFKRMIENPNNKNSKYEYHNRIIIRFFPKDKTSIDDIRRLNNQFYTKRPLYYIEQKSGQQRLDLF